MLNIFGKKTERNDFCQLVNLILRVDCLEQPDHLSQLRTFHFFSTKRYLINM